MPADNPLIQAAQRVIDAHTAAQADPSAIPDAVAAFKAASAVLGTQYAALKAGVSGLAAFQFPPFLGFRREDGTFGGDGG